MTSFVGAPPLRIGFISMGLGFVQKCAATKEWNMPVLLLMFRFTHATHIVMETNLHRRSQVKEKLETEKVYCAMFPRSHRKVCWGGGTLIGGGGGQVCIKT